MNHSFSGFVQATNDSPKMKGERKKVEKNVSVEKIGLGGSYATHCKNDLFNAVFGGCTLPACMCLFKGSTKYHLKAGNKDDWIRKKFRIS